MSPRPLRICFVAYRGNMRCGGQGIYLWHLARELSRSGHRVDVLVGPPYPDPMPFARSVQALPDEEFWGKWFSRDFSGFLPDPPRRVFHPLQFYELGASRLGFLPEPFAASVRALGAYARRLRKGERFDIVHDVQCLGWGLLGIRALGAPIVTTVHHPLSVDRRASFVRDRGFRDALGTMTFYPIGMQSFVARRLDRVITSSEASAAHISRDFGVDPGRIRMLGNGLDTARFHPDPEQPREPGELLCVGRASDPNKGISVLVEALARLPREVHLTLVDRDSAEHETRRQARALGCADRLRITGPLSQEGLVAAYRRASLAVVPSVFEGFGLPAAEAMACGTPVVATRAGALPEVIATGGGGLLVDPANPDALAKGIATLLEQPATRAELSARAPGRIARAYSWERIAERTVEVYREVVSGRPARTTTSARVGQRRANQSSPPSTPSATPAGSRSTDRVHAGSPQASEMPTTASTSMTRDACSRIKGRS
ncbi:MAG: glycosyltransferase family 4 protein [Myxococcota bacterium]